MCDSSRLLCACACFAAILVSIGSSSAPPPANPLTVSTVAAVAMRAPEWQDRWDVGPQNAFAVAVAAKGDYVFAAGGGFDRRVIGQQMVRGYEVRTGRHIWTDQLRKGSDHVSATGIAVTDKHVVVIGVVRDSANKLTGLIRGHDMMTGRLEWEESVVAAGTLNSYLYDIQAVGDRVIITGFRGQDMLVTSLDASTGEADWETLTDVDGGRESGRALAISGQRIFVAGESLRPVAPGQAGAQIAQSAVVIAFHRTSGRELWRDVHDEDGGLDHVRWIAAKGSRVVAAGQVQDGGFSRGFIRALQAGKGRVLWTERWGAARSTASAVAILGKRVFVGGHDNVNAVTRAYLLKSGKMLWQEMRDYSNGDDQVRTLSAAGSRVFSGGRGGFQGSAGATGDWVVFGNNIRNGKELWDDRFDLANREDQVNDSVIAGNWIVLVGQAQEANNRSDFTVRTYRIK